MPIVAKLTDKHVAELAALFATIAADPSAARFHPHDFTAAQARIIAIPAGRDIYLGLWSDGTLQGYGMLRGWDAGYMVPSLGIYLAPPARGNGSSRVLMSALHDHARRAGAHQVRLKVYADNLPAVRLYEALGYVFKSEENGQRVGVIDVGPTSIIEGAN